MKRLTRVSMVLVLACATWATSWHASAGPIIGGKEWYQPVDLVGYSWNDFNAICGAGTCNGLLGGVGPNLTGWTWASIFEVGDLFAATSAHPGGIGEYYSPQFTDDLFTANTGLSGVAGFSSTLAPVGGLAYLGLAQSSVGFPAGPPFGSTFSTESTYSTTEDAPYVGGWLYRASEVPVPATLWLIALGVMALRWSRLRTAQHKS
jgi:hypothetical protein